MDITTYFRLFIALILLYCNLLKFITVTEEWNPAVKLFQKKPKEQLNFFWKKYQYYFGFYYLVFEFSISPIRRKENKCQRWIYLFCLNKLGNLILKAFSVLFSPMIVNWNYLQPFLFMLWLIMVQLWLFWHQHKSTK